MRYQNLLSILAYTLIAIGFAFIIGGQLTGCEPKPMPTSQQQSLPASQNFESIAPPEKLWTADDFKQAEIDPLDIDYSQPCQTNTGFCADNITEMDIQFIRNHNEQRLQKMIAGGAK